MKTKLCFLLSVFLACQLPILAQQPGQDSTGLPGDNFSLHGALQMFQDANSPEDFEKAINTEGNHVNNLDLNGDGDIDYIRVVNVAEKDVHAFILQVPVSESESQDIAVIELEKTAEANAVIQIVGDEEIYGEQVIVEPNGETIPEVQKQGKGPHPALHSLPAYVVVNVWHWPTVRYVYAPTYRPWVSPWRWRVYPTWWRPWRPVTWRVWHPHHHRYHRPFAVVHTHRVVHAHRIYAPVRRTSVSVHNRHSPAVGHWKVNRTKATVTGPRGNKATVRKTTVKGPRGNVRGTRTTVNRRRG